MLGALAVAETVEGLESWARVEVKWPNDVLLDGRKVSGVLSEAVWQGDALLGVVLGIGVNVRVDFTGSDLESTAISLEAALGRPLERGVLLAMLLRRADDWAARLGTKALFDAWKARLTMLGTAVSVTLEDARITGVAEDVLPDGRLILRTPDGVKREIVAADVER
jgi:BirA family biotin operon repressor/biotin-[acetyl-CoA-carboxylase] ligase